MNIPNWQDGVISKDEWRKMRDDKISYEWESKRDHAIDDLAIAHARFLVATAPYGRRDQVPNMSMIRQSIMRALPTDGDDLWRTEAAQ